MSEESKEWLERELAWVDAQIDEIEAQDEAAWLRFREKLLGPLD